MQQKEVKNSFHIAELITKFQKGTIGKAEKTELVEWAIKTNNSLDFIADMVDAEILEKDLQEYKKADVQQAYYKVMERWDKEYKKSNTRNLMNVLKVAAVFIVFLASVTICYIYLHTKSTTVPVSAFTGDIQPGTRKAFLLLSNGDKVVLKPQTDSVVMEQGTMLHYTHDGILVYKDGNVINAEAWNTLVVPRSGEYKVILPDGTIVSLNAASSLRYPVAFTGNKRIVALSGEGYFQVAKNKAKPFIVLVNGMAVQAVGTAFNIHSYPGVTGKEKMVITTVTEGIVKFSGQSFNQNVKAGHTVYSEPIGTLTAKPTNLNDNALAWTQGKFDYNNTALEIVMQDISRWYDVDIQYNSDYKRNKFFTGEISRNVPVSKLLRMIELTGIVHFTLNNNTITVLPY